MRTSRVCPFHRRRGLLAVALLVTAAAGQGLDQRIDQALRADTAPTQRMELIRTIVADAGTAAELVKRGLIPEQTGEVTHAIAEALVQADRHVDHLVPLAQLLLHDAHRTRIGRRIADAGQIASSRKRLVEGLQSIAAGVDAASSGNAELRRGGIRALGVIAWRPALEALVQAWNKVPSGPLADEFRRVVSSVTGQTEAAAAARYLADRPYSTYADLLREYNRYLRKQLDKAVGYREDALKTANAERALAEFDNGNDRVATRIAAARIRELASQKQWGKLTPHAFSERVYVIFIDQRSRAEADPTVLRELLGTLTELWRGNGKAPLRKVANGKTLVEQIRPMARAGATMKDAGIAAVALLGEVGEPAADVLVEFANGFGDEGVRRTAIRKLGRLAATSEQRRDFIRRALAEMLAGGDVAPAVRSELLFTLARSVGSVSLDRLPVKGWLENPKAAPKLSAADLRYCVTLVTNSGSEDALQTLLSVSTSHPDESVRLIAVTEGLLRWIEAKPDSAAALRAHLLGLVTASTQPESLRIKVVTALGESGDRAMNETLAGIVAQKDLPEAVRLSAVNARVTLAERLATRTGGAVSREDLTVALQILDALENVEQRERLAEKIVFAADGANPKLPAGRARFLLAQLKAAKEDDATVARYLQDALLHAERDGLDKESRRVLHTDLRSRAVKAKRHKDAADHSAALAALTDEKRVIATHLTEAAEYAVLADDLARARTHVKEARAQGEPDKATQARLDALDKKLAEDG